VGGEKLVRLLKKPSTTGKAGGLLHGEFHLNVASVFFFLISDIRSNHMLI
jgi:hypothetical protein